MRLVSRRTGTVGWLQVGWLRALLASAFGACGEDTRTVDDAASDTEVAVGNTDDATDAHGSLEDGAADVTGPADTPAAIADTSTVADTSIVADTSTADTEPPFDALGALCQLTLACDRPPLVEDDEIDCRFSVTDGQGTVWYDGAAVVWVRGRISVEAPKRGYGLELRDATGEDAEVDLLGMGSDSDWVLNGLYFDRLLLRNKLGFDLFQSFGGDERYAPQSALCELTLDGAPVGVYALTERIKRDGSRIDIARDDGSGGSFVMKQNDADCFYDNLTTYGCWKLVSPNENDLPESSAAGIRGFLAAMEAAVRSADPYDELTGVFAYVDIDSFVDIVLLEELFKNEDCWYTSMHIWKDQGGKVHFVPWDLDMTFGQFPSYMDYGDPELWIKFRPEWVTVMMASPEFKARLVARWRDLRAGVLADEALFARLDAAQAVLGEAIDRNFALWDIELINTSVPFYPVTDYAEEDAAVRRWISLRTSFMDAHLQDL